MKLNGSHIDTLLLLALVVLFVVGIALVYALVITLAFTLFDWIMKCDTSEKDRLTQE